MLVDIVERLSNWKHASFRRDGSTLETMMEAANEITSLRAELEKAKKDGERYRAIRKSGNNMRVVFGKYPDGINIHATENHLCDTALDEVIDNAMKGKE